MDDEEGEEDEDDLHMRPCSFAFLDLNPSPVFDSWRTPSKFRFCLLGGVDSTDVY